MSHHERPPRPLQGPFFLAAPIPDVSFLSAMRICFAVVVALCLWLAPAASITAASSFSIGSYNVENYLDAPSGTRKPKPAHARAAVAESILLLKADVLALQEIGSPSALAELAATLRTRGLDYPHQRLVEGFDTNIHVAVLSRFPIVQDRSHTNASFLLQGRRYHTSRGFAELDLELPNRSIVTLFVAHLKSRREVGFASQQDLREQEALQLRERIDNRLRAAPTGLLLLAGDLNDVKDSKTVRTLLGRGTTALQDLRPTELPRDSTSGAPKHPRTIAWTHHYVKEDTYSRVDYLLASRTLAARLQPHGTFVLTHDRWSEASDHRPIVARFSLPE